MTQTLEQLSAAATELLPCPFCGEVASFYHIAGNYGYYSSKTGVQCGNGDCLMQPKIAFDDEGYDWNKRTHIPLNSREKSIAAWNTRTGQLVEVQADDATARKFNLGDRVTKTKGSNWTGLVVGFYSTKLTPIGYCVESETECGSVQIYPESALAAKGPKL